MAANSNHMTRVEVAGRSILLSQAEIEAFERRFAEVLASTAPEELAADVAETPNFTGSDADILERDKPDARSVAKPGMPFWQSQRFLIAVGGLLVSILIIGVSLVAERGQGSGTRPPLAIPTVATATTAATTAAATPTTAARESTVVAYFDYQNPESATEITTTGILRVDGQAESWRLISLSGKRPSVWIKLADLPKGVPVADPLPDLAPRPTLPPQPTRQPAAQSGGGSGGDTPAQCLVEADLRYRTEYDVKQDNGDGTTSFMGHATGASCYSQAEADANAAQEEALIIQRHAANMTAAPTRAPSATPMPLQPPTGTPAR